MERDTETEVPKWTKTSKETEMSVDAKRIIIIDMVLRACDY